MTEPKTFNVLISELTQDHPVILERDAGTAVATVPGLLEQLRAAIFSGGEGGGAIGGGPKLPMDAAAVDLLEEITDQATAVLAARTNTPTPYGTAEHYVRLWAGQTDDLTAYVLEVKATNLDRVPAVYLERREYSAVQLAAEWVRRIEDFFNPAKTREIPNACPECGERYVLRVVDGEEKRSSTLKITLDRETGRSVGAKCGACKFLWLPEEFVELAARLGYSAADDGAEDVGVEVEAKSG
ncbi:hypothetical protein D6T64_11980 [Cryobacterium melibiosiphilum]|uniref:Uncharacterized protein n=1 Tax=Cryobacterium melibiosiphilum TaxID=995039 RepID=A0A3A5MFB2_9MICO|nr:hypothetical protein [Cryobacterium melibiosiphilum]RJT88102.1 hypothetical protein D6T64_11980 [Cryobacterium melibiosiphilum]